MFPIFYSYFYEEKISQEWKDLGYVSGRNIFLTIECAFEGASPELSNTFWITYIGDFFRNLSKIIFQVCFWPRGQFRIYQKFLRLEVCKNRGVVYVFANTFWLVYRVVTILLLTQRSRSGGPLRYLEHFGKVHRKFSWGLWKNLSAKNMKFCQNLPISFWVSFFSKSKRFSLFPDIYNLIDAWCHAFFTDAKI